MINISIKVSLWGESLVDLLIHLPKFSNTGSVSV